MRDRLHACLWPGSRSLLLLALVCLPTVRAANIDFTRAMDIYFGTWQVFQQGNPVPISTHTFVELTDRITDGFRVQIQNDVLVDPRVGPALPSWVNLGQTNVEWVSLYLTPDNLPATANFDISIAALGGSVTSDTGFQLLLTRAYLGESFPSLDQLDTYNFYAEVSYFERNGSVTITGVPEPGAAGLLGVALLGGYAVLRYRGRNARR
jgi:hypothetical protein